MSSFTVAISPFTSCETSAHSLIDDEFYFEYLLKKDIDFIYYTSELSARRMIAKFPSGESNIGVVARYKQNGLGHLTYALQLKIRKNSKVIFFGYSEPLVLTWYLLNIFKPFDLILVATNNISARRAILYRRQLQLFFSLINSKLRKLVLHTAHEVHLVSKLAKYVAERCFVKKHHLMISKAKPEAQLRTGGVTISYFGPTKPEKPLRPLIDLVKSDKNRQIIFKIFNVEKTYFFEQYGQHRMPPNVRLFERWMTDAEYQTEFAASDVILMTHTSEFEGKLSGNLCDCVAYGIPCIAQPIEPLLAMQSRYGDIGFLCDFGSPLWTTELIDRIDRHSIETMSENMRVVAAEHSLSSVIDDLDRAFQI